MTYTEQDLEKLKEALLTGATSISVAGRTITFRSQSDILSLITMVQEALNADSETVTNPNKVKSTFTKS